MSGLRLIDQQPLENLLALLKDNELPVGPVVVQYVDYVVRNTGSHCGSPRNGAANARRSRSHLLPGYRPRASFARLLPSP
jgi:hypothetical protein